MGIYFFEKSPTYVKRTDPTIYRRRQVVAGLLKDTYKSTRGCDDNLFHRAQKTLEGEGIQLTKSMFDLDKATLRYAFLFLTALHDDERQEVRRKAGNLRSAILCLEEDKIRTWSDLGYADVLPCENSEPIIQPTIDVQATANSSQDALALLGALAEQIQSVMAENERLKREALDLRALVRQAADDQAYIALIEADLQQAELVARKLREDTRQTSSAAHTHTIAQIAEQHPEFPALTDIAQQLKAKESMKSDTREMLFGLLPKTFAWPNDSGSICYKDPFLYALVTLSTAEKARVIHQIETLAKHGPEYASLHTRKNAQRMPYSPLNCFSSRATDELRFTWHKNGGITIHWVYRKGDTRIRQSEK